MENLASASLKSRSIRRAKRHNNQQEQNLQNESSSHQQQEQQQQQQQQSRHQSQPQPSRPKRKISMAIFDDSVNMMLNSHAPLTPIEDETEEMDVDNTTISNGRATEDRSPPNSSSEGDNNISDPERTVIPESPPNSDDTGENNSQDPQGTIDGENQQSEADSNVPLPDMYNYQVEKNRFGKENPASTDFYTFSNDSNIHLNTHNNAQVDPPLAQLNVDMPPKNSFANQIKVPTIRPLISPSNQNVKKPSVSETSRKSFEKQETASQRLSAGLSSTTVSTANKQGSKNGLPPINRINTGAILNKAVSYNSISTTVGHIPMKRFAGLPTAIRSVRPKSTLNIPNIGFGTNNPRFNTNTGMASRNCYSTTYLSSNPTSINKGSYETNRSQPKKNRLNNSPDQEENGNQRKKSRDSTGSIPEIHSKNVESIKPKANQFVPRTDQARGTALGIGGSVIYKPTGPRLSKTPTSLSKSESHLIEENPYELGNDFAPQFSTAPIHRPNTSYGKREQQIRRESESSTDSVDVIKEYLSRPVVLKKTAVQQLPIGPTIPLITSASKPQTIANKSPVPVDTAKYHNPIFQTEPQGLPTATIEKQKVQSTQNLNSALLQQSSYAKVRHESYAPHANFIDFNIRKTLYFPKNPNTLPVKYQPAPPNNHRMEKYFTKVPPLITKNSDSESATPSPDPDFSKSMEQTIAKSQQQVINESDKKSKVSDSQYEETLDEQELIDIMSVSFDDIKDDGTLAKDVQDFNDKIEIKKELVERPLLKSYEKCPQLNKIVVSVVTLGDASGDETSEEELYSQCSDDGSSNTVIYVSNPKIKRGKDKSQDGISQPNKEIQSDNNDLQLHGSQYDKDQD